MITIKTSFISRLGFGVILLSCLQMQKIQAQPRNLIKLNVLSPLFRSVSLSAEHLISPSQSLQLGAFYTFFRSQTSHYQGFGITPEYRIYLDQFEAPAGFFLQSFFRYQNIRIKDTEKNKQGRLNTCGLGLGLGGQWVFDLSTIDFSFEIYGGVVYDLPLNPSQSKNLETNLFTGINPRFGMTIGWVF